tara:strand:+ start:283 stop:693 length:411 start_codon:yes stop_codon:yes gene_type:complete
MTRDDRYWKESERLAQVKTDEKDRQALLIKIAKAAINEGWQPIETAPRDGSTIMGRWENDISHIEETISKICWQQDTQRGKIIKQGWFLITPQGEQVGGEWYPCPWAKYMPTLWKPIDGELDKLVAEYKERFGDEE